MLVEAIAIQDPILRFVTEELGGVIGFVEETPVWLYEQWIGLPEHQRDHWAHELDDGLRRVLGQWLYEKWLDFGNPVEREDWVESLGTFLRGLLIEFKSSLR